MPAPLATPSTAIHLYRHLLREASYLPPACRARIEPRIRLRFCRHRHDPSPEPRLQRAQHDLRYLRAANRGHLERMRRIVLLTFGRIGWRRRELMTELVRQAAPDDSSMGLDATTSAGPALPKTVPTGTALSGVDLPHEVPPDTVLHSTACPDTIPSETRPTASTPTDAATPPRKPDWLDKWDTDKLLFFAKSQGGHNLHRSPRPEVRSKRLNPDVAVPAENIWGKPVHEGTARTKQKKWWKLLANRILPPLPKGEWDLLSSLATEQPRPEWAVPPRRAPAQPAGVAGDSKTAVLSSLDRDGHETLDWDWEAYASSPVRAVDRPRSRRRRALHGLVQHSTPDEPFEGPALGVHRFTPRLWRRLYADVWQMSATMERVPGPGAPCWSVTWGGGQMVPIRAPPAYLASFEGVDAEGKSRKEGPVILQRKK